MKQGILRFLALLPLITGTSASAAEPLKLLPSGCEEALALSAVPERLRADATVYGLEKDGYRKSRTGDGAFTCLVTRNHPESIVPVCFDRAGKDFVTSLIRRGEMAQQGLPDSDYLAERAVKGKASDQFGLSYMVSNYNYIYIPPMKRIAKVPPHVMYYAPHVTDADIGGSQQDGMTNTGMPYMNDSGIHGMIISNVAQASDSSAVIQHCTGQLMDEPAGFGG